MKLLMLLWKMLSSCENDNGVEQLFNSALELCHFGAWQTGGVFMQIWQHSALMQNLAK